MNGLGQEGITSWLLDIGHTGEGGKITIAGDELGPFGKRCRINDRVSHCHLVSKIDISSSQRDCIGKGDELGLTHLKLLQPGRLPLCVGV